MSRLHRIDVPGLPQHVVVRGNNRADCFVDDGDRWAFLKYLVDATMQRDCDLHAYVLMTNHVHLLATGKVDGALSMMMMDTGRQYVRYFNARRGRTGTLFEGRFRASVIDSDRYFLACMRYIEMNPVRAGMAAHPSGYAWSSHGDNSSGAPEEPLTPHAQYLQLGRDQVSRALAYRALFETPLQGCELDAIRGSLAKNRVLGGDRFIADLAARLHRRVEIRPPGRPRKIGTGQNVT